MQGCALRGIPQELVQATRLQRLRIIDDLDYLTLGAPDADVLASMQSLTFLSIAKVQHCTQICLGLEALSARISGFGDLTLCPSESGHC